MLFQDWKTYFSVCSGRSSAIVDVVGAVCANIVFCCLRQWVKDDLFRGIDVCSVAVSIGTRPRFAGIPLFFGDG